jgi:transposase
LDLAESSWDNLAPSGRWWCSGKIAFVFLKRHRLQKDGKEHVYYSICESVRVSRRRVTQRKVLHLGELNTTQLDRWQRAIEVICEGGERRQMRLFSDRENQSQQVALEESDVALVQLSSLLIRRPRQFGACWVGCQLFEELALDQFWSEALAEHSGDVPWAKVVELLAVNRLIAPRSELSIHEKWYPQSAMGLLLDTSDAVAEKDRLYRALDRMVEHKGALEKHLAQRWQDLFGASFDLLLYDLTSTYFEGEAEEVSKAKRGYSRDHRPDCKQVLLALIVTPEGFPLSYEVLDGNRRDVTTLEEMLDAVEGKYGKARRIWVFDRGIVSEANLQRLRQRGGCYIVGTLRSQLSQHDQRLARTDDWQKVNQEVEVQLIRDEDKGSEKYILARSATRAQKERAMRMRAVRGLMRQLVRLRKSLRHGRLKDRDKLLLRIGQLKARFVSAWKYVRVKAEGLTLRWTWNKATLRQAAHRDGAYLLRTNLKSTDPQTLWRYYIQLTEVEAAFRALKSDLAIRPIWHFTERRVEAHIMVAFLGYCLWVCLRQKLKAFAPSLTPWQLLDQLGRITLVEVWFQLHNGGCICLERITQPEPTQQVLIHQIGWSLPQQPPPKIYPHHISGVWTT